LNKYINLAIPGEPCAKGRPRLGKFGTYTPTKTVNYETLVKELFIISKQEKLEGQLQCIICAYYSVPKSGSKKVRQDKLDNTTRPVKKPDADNIAKIILDSLNKLAYDDDSQIVSLRIEKFYDENPKVEVVISGFQEGEI